MRKLHLVGLTTDRDGLIFTARKGSKSGGFIVPLDDNVLKAIAVAGAASNGVRVGDAGASDAEVGPRRPRSESALTPREMQARLRAGRSIEEVATEANVDPEWVARFAVPILAEQAQVVELARSLVYAKPRLGESTQALGPSVLQNLSDRGVFLPDDVAKAGWSAFQLHDSVWMVRFRYLSRGRDQEAQWEIDVPTGRLRARNRHASDLGYVDADRWRAAVEPDDMPDEQAEAPAAPPRRRAAKPTSKAEPMAKAVATAKRLTAARTVVAPARATKAGPAAKAATSTKAGATRSTPAKAVKAAAGPQQRRRATKATTGRVTRGGRAPATAKAVPAGRKASPRTASGRPATKRTTKPAPAPDTGPTATTRTTKPAPVPDAEPTATKRTTKARPAPDSGPVAGSGGVRMAVARVSTARVAASMAVADREPWAAVVRRPPRPAVPQQTESRRRPPPEPVARPSRQAEAEPGGRAFAPRPLPAPGEEPPAPRVRKVTVPRPVRIAGDGPAPVSLPTPHRPMPPQEPLPAERSKRRRSRSR